MYCIYLHLFIQVASLCRLCHISEGASLTALQRVQLQGLELTDISGATTEELDCALEGMGSLHRLHVSYTGHGQ
jgi:hypothetical protein